MTTTPRIDARLTNAARQAPVDHWAAAYLRDIPAVALGAPADPTRLREARQLRHLYWADRYANDIATLAP